MENIFTRKNTTILGLLGFIQFLWAAIWTATISKSSSSMLLGYSTQRLALIILIGLLAAVSFACSCFAFFRWDRARIIITDKASIIYRIYISLLIGTTIFFFVVFHSPAVFGKNFDAYSERLLPLAISSFLLMLEVLVFQFVLKNPKVKSKKRISEILSQNKPVIIISIVLLAVILYSYVTKFGLVFKTRYWNVPGIPVSTQQFLFIFIIFGILYFLYLKVPGIRNLLVRKKVIFIIALVIYFVTVIIWGNTPLERHYFSLVPTAPNFQPYPYSDARFHDLGALSILMGKGVFFHNYTDKPLLMVIFAFSHLFAGNDYVLLQNVLVALLAIIPVFVFLISAKFQNPAFGLFTSSIVIIQQKNAILLSTIIASVNVKLQVTETFTLLGIVFLVLILFLWAKTKSEKYIFLAGVIVACISLIRMNPLIYIPAISFLILIVFWKAWKNFAKQLLMLFLGFMVVFSPWIITGTNPEGIPWAAVKIIDVIKNRVTPTLEEHQSSLNQYPDKELFSRKVKIPPIMDGIDSLDLSEIERTSILPIDQMGLFVGIGEDPGLEETYLYLFANHLFHNINTVFLSLPDAMIDQDIFTVAHREYFQDENDWNGSLPGKQIFLILINFVLFSLGLYYGWRKHSWIGLIPAFCMFTYILSISISLTSGGRYIVPINWILYFYYILGIVSLFDFFLPIKKAEDASDAQEMKEQIVVKQAWSSIIIGVAIISILIPVSNKLLPVLISPPAISDDDYEMIQSKYGVDNIYQEGIVFYPYYKDGNLSLDIVQDGNIRSFKVQHEAILDSTIWLNNQEFVLFTVNEKNEIAELFINRDSQWRKYISINKEIN